MPYFRSEERWSARFLLLASIANIFLQLTILQLVVSAIAVLIFSAYILFDVQRIINGGETNYITATLSIYLDYITCL